MTERFTEGDLVAYVGADDPPHDLYEGQPGVVIDVGPGMDISIEFASGPTGSVELSEMAPIDMTQYRARAERMRRHMQPTA